MPRENRYRVEFPSSIPVELRPIYSEIMHRIVKLDPKEVEKVLDGSMIGLTTEEKINKDRVVRKLQKNNRELASKYRRLIDTNEELMGLMDVIDALNNNKFVAEAIPMPDTDGNISHGCALVQWSDWHIEETVDPGTVNGLNEFSPDIAWERSENLTRNTIKLIKANMAHYQIGNLVIHLGGDFIGNWIHPELEQTNAMSPIEATIEATNMLENCLKTIREHFDGRIVCLCSRGNHGRNSKKMQHANEAETNYETFIYTSLAKKFEGQIEFEIKKSAVAYFDIFGLKIRYFHGQQVRYGGGVGGITIPLNKKIFRWNDTIEADYNLMGHYHTLSYPTKDCTINGSLKGYDAFASNLGFSYERPMQGFHIIDAERKMITTRQPIFCDE